VLPFLLRYGFVAICGAIILEELAIPMPIPTDVLIVTAGATGGDVGRFILWFVLISLASATGATGLYAILQRGGRPLVARFGRYVHLGPKALARGEALLARGGWWGIALGRATPGLRLPTVVMCALLGVPYRRFITAHMTGSAVYILAFLALGRYFGQGVLESVHLPRVSTRLLGLLLLTIGLPALLVRFARRAHIDREDDIAPGRHLTVGAAVLASLAGTVVFAAAWAASFAVTDIAGLPPPVMIGYRFVRRVIGQQGAAFLLGYTSLILAGIALGTIYLELILPHLTRWLRTLPSQVAGLAGVTLALAVWIAWHAGVPDRPHAHIAIGVTLTLGSIAYAIAVVYARALALALIAPPNRATALPVVSPTNSPPEQTD
jgi:membrane protein DedA with SNARE-associated domain